MCCVIHIRGAICLLTIVGRSGLILIICSVAGVLVKSPAYMVIRWPIAIGIATTIAVTIAHHQRHPNITSRELIQTRSGTTSHASEVKAIVDIRNTLVTPWTSNFTLYLKWPSRTIHAHNSISARLTISRAHLDILPVIHHIN